MRMTNTVANRIVRKWLAEKGHVFPKDLPAVEFASRVRRISEEKVIDKPFASKAEAISYVHMMAAAIRHAPDKPPLSWWAERARQDKRHGYRLLAKQKQAKRERVALKAKRDRELIEAKARYEEHAKAEWPIVRSGD